MTIFDFAIKMEQEGEDYYRQMAERISLPGIKRIFGFLADEEVRHAEILTQMRDGGDTKPLDSTLLSDSRSIFNEFKITPPTFNVNQADLEIYEHALDIEQRSEAYYRAEASKTPNESTRAALNRIADEEKRHVFLLEQLKDYASRPYQWIENSEFNHLDSY